jgi:two-component system sensor kinase FixL
VSSSGTVRSANPAAGQVFGLPADSLVGENIADLITLEPAQLEELSRDRNLDHETEGTELRARRSDGSVVPIELTVGSADPSDVSEYTLIVHDISQRKHVEQERRAHLSELAHFSRVALAGEMAAALAHEVSQPLAAIVAYARGLRLLTKPVADNQIIGEGVSEIVKQSERAAHIIARLRELVRHGRCRPSLVPVKRMIEAAVDFARIEASKKAISIQLDVAPRLPRVFADSIQIEQVLLNLIRNSIDAIADGTRRKITVRALQNGASVEISVQDTGSGISDEMQERVFEPFLTTKDGGMGMGLAISRRIIHAHGGNLLVAPSSGPGATFTFDLPTQVSKDDVTD